MILENFDQLSNPQKAMFADTCNKLLACAFLAKDKKDNKELYYFVLSFKNYFDEYFGIIGYELFLDRERGAIQLVSAENTNLLKLKKDESLVLLILRILYHQHLVQTSINDNVIITVDEIHQKYDSLELKKKINKTDLVAIIRLYRRYNLVEPLGDITQGNTRIVVYPTILMAINTQTINDVVDSLNRIVSQQGGKDNEEAV
ncbi:MAG: DUF4194 domain-containing protein [Candidatus Izemoplasmatales bacterium]|jgi:hypothetical protein|nr:DUF4194 domain-containing protein [Candidatus Izemoplasmatales bacterium]MDD3865789.1 DUF4194 domain-containing protein [Candidatus Izemoplasmatales bacterium]